MYWFLAINICFLIYIFVKWLPKVIENIIDLKNSTFIDEKIDMNKKMGHRNGGFTDDRFSLSFFILYFLYIL